MHITALGNILLRPSGDRRFGWLTPTLHMSGVEPYYFRGVFLEMRSNERNLPEDGKRDEKGLSSLDTLDGKQTGDPICLERWGWY